MTELGEPLRPESYRRSLVAINEKAGITDCTSHTLRHTAASQLLDAGVPLGVVSDVLGHADMSMLVKTYRHSTNAIVGGHVAAMNDGPSR
jgi:site-specific recombinase XerD